MLLYPRQYVRFIDGREGDSAVLAILPGELAARMPTLSTEIKIHRAYAIKIWEKHNLRPNDLAVVQKAVLHGWCTKSRNDSLDFLYVDPTTSIPRRLIVGIKSAYGGQETWLTTMYKAEESEIRRRLKKARKANRLIRSHVWT
jgi:hypothetical protein